MKTILSDKAIAGVSFKLGMLFGIIPTFNVFVFHAPANSNAGLISTFLAFLSLLAYSMATVYGVMGRDE